MNLGAQQILLRALAVMCLGVLAARAFADVSDHVQQGARSTVIAQGLGGMGILLTIVIAKLPDLLANRFLLKS